MPHSIVVDAAGLHAFLEAQFPQALETGSRIVRCDAAGLSLELETTDQHLRPGGTLSGPTLMTMADAAAYLAILSRVGLKALAVTSGLQIHFLQKAVPGRLVADATVVRLGRRVAVVSVEFSNDGREGPVAIATVTYILP